MFIAALAFVAIGLLGYAFVMQFTKPHGKRGDEFNALFAIFFALMTLMGSGMLIGYWAYMVFSFFF